MTKVFYRELKGDMPIAVKGRGIYLYDENGKRYLDGSGGAAVSCLGHSDPDVTKAIKHQVDQFAFAHTGFLSSGPAEQLAEFLVDAAPRNGMKRDMAMVYFVSGGSEAVESALKMARQYFLEVGQPERTRFIARRQSYHGNTLGALSVGGNVWRRDPYKEMLMPVSHIAPCYAYRDQRDDENEEEYGHRVADELEAEIERLGPRTVAAFIAETVGGATAGVITPVPGYFQRIREICDRHGVLMILDEVMCGMGRTGTLFAYEAEGVVPDIVCIAKGLGGGYQPIGATLVSGEIYSAFKEGSGSFQHGHTYMGHPTACAAALAVQKKIEDLDLLQNVNDMGDRLVERLHDRLGNHRNVGDIRGRGLFHAIELVADRATKEPLNPTLQVHARVKRTALDQGLICYPGGGTADGVKGDHIMLAPPFIMTVDQVDELVGMVGDALDIALAEAGIT